MLADRTALRLLLLALAACSSGPSVTTAPPDSGEKATYKTSFERVRTAALDALRASDFSIDEDKRLEQVDWTIVASQGLGSGTLGRRVRLTLRDRKEGIEVWVLVDSSASGKAGDMETNAIAAQIQREIATRLK
jgi:hypothetical protein